MKNCIPRRKFIKSAAAVFISAAAIVLPKFHTRAARNISNKEADYYVKVKGSRLAG